MAMQYLEGKTPDTIKPVCTTEDILRIKETVSKVKITEEVVSYVEDIIELTRKEARFLLGASPRAMLALVKAAQSKAFLQGRDYVKPDDIKEMAEPVLLHRISLTSEAKIRKEDASKILRSLVLKAKVPVV